MAVMVGRLVGPVAFQSVGRFVSGPGWRHMRRTMDQHELVFVRRGVLPIRVGERRMHIAAHEVALFPLGVEHAGTESITADLEFYWMHFRLPVCAVAQADAGRTVAGCAVGMDTAAEMGAEHRAVGGNDDDGLHPMMAGSALPKDDRYLILPDLAEVANPDRLSVMFAQMVDLFAEFGPYRNAYCDYFATSLLLEVSAQERARRSGRTSDSGLAAMRSVRAWLRANAYEDVTVAGVAERFHYTPSYLTSLYRRVFGIGVAEQIAEYRIDRARELLSSTTSPVTDIAAEVGYDDPKYFMRVFKRRTGLTPTQYREAFPARLFNTE